MLASLVWHDSLVSLVWHGIFSRCMVQGVVYFASLVRTAYLTSPSGSAHSRIARWHDKVQCRVLGATSFTLAWYGLPTRGHGPRLPALKTSLSAAPDETGSHLLSPRSSASAECPQTRALLPNGPASRLCTLFRHAGRWARLLIPATSIPKAEYS